MRWDVDSQQIDEILLNNTEILAELLREQKTRKNKNFMNSNIINLGKTVFKKLLINR